MDEAKVDQVFILGLFGIIFCVILGTVFLVFKRYQIKKRREEKGVLSPKMEGGKSLGLGIGVFIVLFFMVEGWIKLNYPEGRGILGKYFVHDPYAIYKTKARGGKLEDTYYIQPSNNLGLRRTEDTVIKKPANTYRILFTGGSTAWGLMSRVTIDTFLEELIQKDFPNTRIEVLNASAVGYMTYQHLIRYVTFLQYLEPDMVIAMDGHNDFYKVYDPITEFHESVYSKFLWPIADKSLIAGALVMFRNLGEISNIFKMFYTVGTSKYIFPKVENAQTELDFKFYNRYNWDSGSGVNQFRKDYIKSFNKTIIETYRSMHALFAIKNIDFVIASQPELFLRDIQLLTQYEKDFREMWMADHGGENMVKSMKASYKIFPGLLQKAADEMSATIYLDLEKLTLNYGGPRKRFFTTYCHLNQGSAKYVADVFYSHIKKTLEQRIGSVKAKV